MRLLHFQLPVSAVLLFLSSSAVSDVFASSSGLHIPLKHRRNWSAFTNRTVLHPEDPIELQKRDGTKYVFMHHIVGNTYGYPYTYADWLDDMNKIAAKGIDAIALNIGGDDWQRTQVGVAYQAAMDSGTGIKLFYSFDLTAMACDLDDLVARTNLYAAHPNQFKVNGKVMVSSYSGDCLGNSGWANLKSRTNAYLMPFIWGLENQFQNWPSLDSWYCWGCAWPQGDYDKNTNDDNFYISQLGSRYATTISGWMYAHLSSKNFYLRGDDWLIVSRWEQLMAMRNTLTFVEMVTWNDWGESDYFGPFKGAQPTGTYYAQNFPHTAWFDLSAYYISAFKTGVYPTITQSTIYFWARPHPAGATASGDSLGKPTGWDWADDSMWAAVFASAPATVILQCGGSTQTFSVGTGISKLKIPLSAGQMTVQMIRNSQTIINYTPAGYTYVTNPVQYNYNAWVGSATASNEGTGATSSSASTSATTTTSASSTSATTTSATTTSTTSSATATGAPGWSYLGCYPDSPTRILVGLAVTDNTQTIEKCLTTCQNAGYAYGGVEYGTECYCSNAIASGVTAVAESQCAKPCAGKATETCGDGYRINIYHYSGSGTTPPTTTWSNYGCVAEGTTGTRRALTGPAFEQTTTMTPNICQALCVGYAYAGVEYGYQCFCGNTLTNNGATGVVISPSSCASNCAGDSSKKCGGSWTMNVFTNVVTPSWTSAGCFVDAPTRILRGIATQNVVGLTTEQCINSCATAGYTMAATEAGNECYCGSQLFKENGAGVAAASGTCSTACDGNSTEMCGGGWRANLYLKPGTTIT